MTLIIYKKNLNISNKKNQYYNLEMSTFYITDVQIDHFCSQHDVVCCRACLSDSHRSCESVLPLDSASKDVKNSSLLITNCFHDGSTSRNIMTLIIYKKKP
jgi:hypothetical protein